MNFEKLKKLISEYESQDEPQQIDFFKKLKTIAENELNNKQINLNQYF